MPALELVKPDEPLDREKLEEKALAWSSEVKELKVKDAKTFELADIKLSVNKALQKEIADTFDPSIKRWHDGHKAEIAMKNKLLAPLEAEERRLKCEMTDWRDEQKRLEAIEEARLLQEATNIETDARLDVGIALENAGEHEAAERIVSAPLSIAPPRAVSAIPKTKTTFSEVWKHEVVSLMDYVKAVAAGKAPLAGLIANEDFFRKQATALKAEANYPGVRFFSNTQTAGKR